MKRISILGSTGSIGRQSLAVVDQNPGQFEVVAIAAGSNVELAAEQTIKHRPQLVSVSTPEGTQQLRDLLSRASAKSKHTPEIAHGPAGIEAVATHPDAQMLISAAVGVVGLRAT